MDLEQAIQNLKESIKNAPNKLEYEKNIQDRLQLLVWLDYERLKADYIELDKQLRTANTEIDRLQSVSSWIPCSKRMPEDDEEVLFAVVYPWDKDKKTRVTLGRRRTKNGKIWWANSYCHFSDYDVTHWMPLPSLPEVINNVV